MAGCNFYDGIKALSSNDTREIRCRSTERKKRNRRDLSDETLLVDPNRTGYYSAFKSSRVCAGHHGSPCFQKALHVLPRQSERCPST